MTPHRWLTIRRVDKAKTLLRQSATLSLAQIGLACGFADQSHFTHVFTAVVGAAPENGAAMGGAVGSIYGCFTTDTVNGSVGVRPGPRAIELRVHDEQSPTREVERCRERERRISRASARRRPSR